jgi:hypothetical protein
MTCNGIYIFQSSFHEPFVVIKSECFIRECEDLAGIIESANFDLPTDGGEWFTMAPAGTDDPHPKPGADG